MGGLRVKGVGYGCETAGRSGKFALAMRSVSGAAEGKWALVIHGGVGEIVRGSLTPAEDTAHRAGLSRAVDASSTVLASGGTALDAVEQAVRVLEDDPAFNAGRGAVFSHKGRNELDAAIMDGTTLKAGAVAGVTRTKNPVTLARAVMERSSHVMLSGAGADEFSLENDVEQTDPDWFHNEARWQELQEALRSGAFDGRRHMGTVGAVARDRAGHVAAATSTGGITNKRWGRVGDSPIIGAGTYADDRGCAVSATGSGEFFIRVGAAHEICARVRLIGADIQTAADGVVKADIATLGGTGGVIVIGRSGIGGWSFTTPGMYRARAAEGHVREIAVYGDELATARAEP